MLRRIKITDEEYWILMELKVKYRTDSLIGIFQALGLEIGEEVKIEAALTVPEKKIYSLIKEAPRTAEEMQSLLGLSGGRISQILRGKDGTSGLLNKRTDIIVDDIGHNVRKYRYSITPEAKNPEDVI